ncbi:UNVERIFIED_CONTAM: hypothetical protein FKN15_039568 [Acipenser sinensis]
MKPPVEEDESGEQKGGSLQVERESEGEEPPLERGVEREEKGESDSQAENHNGGLDTGKAPCKRKKKKKKRRYGLREAGDSDEWTVYWTDCSVSLDRVMEMKRYQKINHFPGMSEICRKDLLARNMNRMRKLFPKEYNIFPRTWCLPAENEELKQSQAAWLQHMERYEAAHLGGFRKIYPREDSEKYDKYFKHSGSLFQETAASRAREECARQQLQELRVKQEQREVLQKSRRADLQGESAGERAKPWKAAHQAGREPTYLLP